MNLDRIVPFYSEGRIGDDPDEWKQGANCASTDPDLFFPESYHSRQVFEAQSVCEACDVRARCLQWALENNETHGILGGLTPLQRRRLADGAA